VLKPSRDLPLDDGQLASAMRRLGAPPAVVRRGDYFAMAGIAGQPPALAVSADRPFTRDVVLDGTPLEIRMESWLAFHTIRRMGFGHAVAARRHTLVIERGVSFAVFDADGRPLQTAYASNIFAPQPRFMIRPRT